MTSREEWVSELKLVFENFPDKRCYHLSTIYDRVKKGGRIDLSSPHWKSRVRDNLERHSCDSEIWNGVDDFFYKQDPNKRDGYWGMRL